jgi:hypothetical protein
LNFEILLDLNHDDVTWGREGILRVLGKSEKSCKYLVLENHKFCFDIPKKFVVILISKISTKHGILL